MCRRTWGRRGFHKVPTPFTKAFRWDQTYLGSNKGTDLAGDREQRQPNRVGKSYERCGKAAWGVWTYPRWQRAPKVHNKGMTRWNSTMVTTVPLCIEGGRVSQESPGTGWLGGQRADPHGEKREPGRRQCPWGWKGKDMRPIKGNWRQELRKWTLETPCTEMGTLWPETDNRDWRSAISVGKMQVSVNVWDRRFSGMVGAETIL